jgi:hypothetical protein
LIVLLFFFWYCHKRGKEMRLKREEKEKMTDSKGRIAELKDDPMLEGAENRIRQETERGSSGKDTESQRPKRKPVSADHS